MVTTERARHKHDEHDNTERPHVDLVPISGLKENLGRNILRRATGGLEGTGVVKLETIFRQKRSASVSPHTIFARPKSVMRMSEAMDLLANRRFSGWVRGQEERVGEGDETHTLRSR